MMQSYMSLYVDIQVFEEKAQNIYVRLDSL